MPARFTVTGEISPPYFFMPDEGVAHVRRLCPNTKIVIFVRNPMEWCWSFAKMNFLRNQGRHISDIDEAEFLAYVKEKTSRNHFSRSIVRWRRHFPEEQLKIIFFDRLVAAPAEVYEEMSAFIGLDPARMPVETRATVAKRVNPGVDAALPPRLALELARCCRADIDALCDLFDGYPQKWRDQLERRLSEG